ncbi:site-specific integrase [Tuberibacillus calidus]|jgi:integrase|uniref:site-specific integrase n=1 Tax=Tuberibacillus calidus TaxID=340097 RepID=UPI0004282030|nr:site-specific integrase [Tuberibacillus calidus]
MAGSVHKYVTKKGEQKWFYMLDLGKDENGKRKQKKKSGFKSEREAKKALRLAEAEVIKGTYVEPSKLPYETFVNDWFKNIKKKSLGVQTQVVYERYLESYIIPSIGNIPLGKITTDTIDRFISDLYDKKYSASTIKKAVNIIKSSLEYAIIQGYIKKNFAKQATLPKETKNEMTVWNQEEVNKFLDAAKGSRYYNLFFVALTTGMRQGELFGLRWKDIDFKNKTLTVNQVLDHDGQNLRIGTKTKSSHRTIDLSDKTIQVLLDQKKKIEHEKSLDIGYQDNDLVFCTPLGTPLHPSNIRKRVFNKLIEKAQVPKIRFHDLRHTHATLLLQKKVNPKVVSERLGHANVKITLDTYSHVLPTMQKEAVQKIDDIFE